MSLPSRERGLKYQHILKKQKLVIVAPFAGAWIEIVWLRKLEAEIQVAPFAGAWIEMI